MPPPENWLTKLTGPRTHRTAGRLLTHTLGGLLVLEYRNDRRRAAQSQLLPPRHHVVVSVLGQLGALGEGLDEAIVHASVDQTLRSPRPDLRRVQAGIEIGAPG